MKMTLIYGLIHVAAFFLIPGCASANDRLVARNHQAAKVETRYPRGTGRDEIVKLQGNPDSTFDLTKPGSARTIVRNHLKQIAAEVAGTPVRYDVFMRWRGRHASIGQPDVYDDYVYYDPSSRCIWARRVKID